MAVFFTFSLVHMALPPKMDTPRIVRTKTPLTDAVRGGTKSTGRTMSYRTAQHEFGCQDISRPSHGRDCGIEKDERSDGPSSWSSGPVLDIRLLVPINILSFDIVLAIVLCAMDGKNTNSWRGTSINLSIN